MRAYNPPISPIKETQMITKFAGASIWSENLNNLLPFYRDVLGINLLDDPEGAGFVRVGARSDNEPALGIGTHSDVRGRNNDPVRFMIGFESDNIMADWKRLKAAGVEFVQEPQDDEYLMIATLKDPEGNYVQLFQLSQSK